jgi:exodeoxyribonuclease VII small subunit
MKSEKKARTFESDMARLEEIVSLLENGGAPLDETMSLYAEGAKLAAECSSKLEKAEQTIARVDSQKAEKKDETKDG